MHTVQVGGDLLDGATFVSNVSADLAQGIARNVKCDLKQYLTYV